ncbi:PCP reductase family protein [Neptuniibacter halophilus]|uniref:PCP reductase family protein n=1 Tax=Neptuniibacter halophilus TaxID=651666 RepID=UPI002572821F|nr:PCP reductase family protein [Neptuniibacter halophilus]
MADKLEWEPAAQARVDAAPFFVRKLIRHKVEKAARQQGLSLITEALLDQVKQKQMDKPDN